MADVFKVALGVVAMRENKTQGGSWEKWKLGLMEKLKSNKCGALQSTIKPPQFTNLSIWKEP
jgi:hypothetical protein